MKSSSSLSQSIKNIDDRIFIKIDGCRRRWPVEIWSEFGRVKPVVNWNYRITNFFNDSGSSNSLAFKTLGLVLKLSFFRLNIFEVLKMSYPTWNQIRFKVVIMKIWHDIKYIKLFSIFILKIKLRKSTNIFHEAIYLNDSFYILSLLEGGAIELFG